MRAGIVTLWPFGFDSKRAKASMRAFLGVIIFEISVDLPAVTAFGKDEDDSTHLSSEYTLDHRRI